MVEKLRRFNISSLEHTFAKFRANAETQEAVDTLESVASGESDRQFILLYGATGCGKTHLIEATVIAWAQRGIGSRYQTFSEIARHLKSSLRNPPEYEIYFKNLCDAERLIIDDFGSGTTESRFEVSDLEDIIDTRYRRRYYPTKQVTILASNKDIKELPDRVISRFFDPEFGSVVCMGNVDYRRRKV